MNTNKEKNKTKEKRFSFKFRIQYLRCQLGKRGTARCEPSVHDGAPVWPALSVQVHGSDGRPFVTERYVLHKDERDRPAQVIRFEV